MKSTEGSSTSVGDSDLADREAAKEKLGLKRHFGFFEQGQQHQAPGRKNALPHNAPL